MVDVKIPSGTAVSPEERDPELVNFTAQLKTFLVSKTFFGIAVAFLSWLLPKEWGPSIGISITEFQTLVDAGVIGGAFWALYGKFHAAKKEVAQTQAIEATKSIDGKYVVK